MESFSEWFWDEKFWLTPGIKWEDLRSKTPGVYYGQFSDIGLPSILMGLLMTVIRFACFRLIFIPFGKQFGIRVKRPRNAVPNPILEVEYKKSKFPKEPVIESLVKKTSLTEREIQRWFRVRRQQGSPGNMQKFCECCWNFLFYGSIFIYGVIVLWDEPWFWETKYCFIDWPYQHISDGLYWYYMLEMGYYWGLLFSLMFDYRRKDWMEMTLHHVITLLLMGFSWGINFSRIGCMIVITHDVADNWMASAKMAKYCKKQKLCEVLFGVFVILWLFTRCYVFPFKMLYAGMVEIHEYVDRFPVHDIFVGLLLFLQVLHLLWTYSILSIAFQKFTEGELKKDVRSDTEDDDDETNSDDNANESMKDFNTILPHVGNGDMGNSEGLLQRKS
ncbi:ceramide synthase 4-like [Ylistrum balloti]|uniref:ceramide synthase 4-like n=1 Tax=Ylistrum balloti TaxID=509963 RepID=UPI002905A5C2|nr:ceramide synthase 4-like [Ylistrum balloti]